MARSKDSHNVFVLSKEALAGTCPFFTVAELGPFRRNCGRHGDAMERKTDALTETGCPPREGYVGVV